METLRAQKPLLRGYLHLAAAVCSPGAFAYLLWLADAPREYAGVIVFGIGMVLLFATSAAYHTIPWPRSVAGIVRRVDHAVIFVFVAATYTPFCLVAIGLEWGVALLSVVSALALAGVARSLAWPDAPRWLNLGTYLAVGWAAIGAAPVLVTGLEGHTIALMLAGGILYSLGGICHAARWPNPLPRYFGHHEVFHAATVVATAFMYIAVAIVVVGA